MLTSRDLLEASGISRATLNNYIAQGLLPRPDVRRQPPAPGEKPTTLGYFPDWALERLQRILTLKQSGLTLEQIQKTLPVSEGQTAEPADPPSRRTEESSQSRSYPSGGLQYGESLQVTIDRIPYLAYMVNYDFQLVWLNPLAQQEFFAKEPLPDRAEDRSLLPLLFGWSAELPKEEQRQLLIAHLSLIKHRLPRQAFSRNLAGMPERDRNWLLECYDDCPDSANHWTQAAVISHPDIEVGPCRLVTMSFREGILVVYVPESEGLDAVMGCLSRRDAVIRTLLGQRLPVLTPLAVLVGDLQNSVRICAELPPEEYFELINQIWATLDPIFREYYGAYGKHTGDGMLYYFFPQPDRNYLLSTVQCAIKIREAMRQISHQWQLRKGWSNQLYMNIGLGEGEEWLGTFKTNTNHELVVLGQTINTAARLSDLARFGKIWATKGLISKLGASERQSIRYGIERTLPDGLSFVQNTFAQVESLVNSQDGRYGKLMDIGSVVVAEIQSKD